MAKPPPEHITANVYPDTFNNITCLANPIQRKTEALNEHLIKKGVKLIYAHNGIIPKKKKMEW